MERFIFELDETSAKVLKGKKNKAQIVRNALALYNGDITTDNIQGLRESYKRVLKETEKISKRLDTMDANVAALAKKAGSVPDEFSDFGA